MFSKLESFLINHNVELSISLNTDFVFVALHKIDNGMNLEDYKVFDTELSKRKISSFVKMSKELVSVFDTTHN